MSVNALAGASPRGESTLLQSLPVPVRRAILAEVANDGAVNDVSRTNSDDGDVIYDVDFTRGRKSRNMTVALDGRLLDIQVYLSETPLGVQKALAGLSQGGQLGDIAKDIGLYEDFTYEAEITRGGVSRNYTLDDDGGVLERQVFLEELPSGAQAAVTSKLAGAVLRGITERTDEDGVNYETAMNRSGTNRTFSVSTNGQMLEEQVFLPEIPGAVQKAVLAQGRRGHLGKINKSADGGKDYYEVEIRIGANTGRVTFDGGGVVDSEEEEMAWATVPTPVRTVLLPLKAADEVVDDVTRTTEGTNTCFEVELRKGRFRRSITFTPEGKVVPP